MAAEPPLTEWQRLAWRAFTDLLGERGIASEYLGPIYWRAIVAWCDRYGVQDAERFIELVQGIDRDYLNEQTAATPNRPHPRIRDGAQKH